MADGKLNLGRVRPAYLGDYDPATAYKVMDRVSFNGHVYECIAETTAGIEPGKSQSAYWLPITVDSPAPEARWNGTKLYFEYPDGKTTEQVDLKGEPGKKGDDGSPATVEITSDYTSEDPNVAFSALGANRLYKVIQSGGVELSDAVDSDSSVTGASSKAVKLAYDKAVVAETSAGLAETAANSAVATANAASTAAGNAASDAAIAKASAETASTNAAEAKETAENALTTANAASETANSASETATNASNTASSAQATANMAVPKTGARGSLSGYEAVGEADSLGEPPTVSIDSPDCINLETSGAVTLAFTPADPSLRAVKALSITASEATTLTISGAVWANKGTAPTWGDAGKILVLMAHFVGGRVVLSVADNTQ